MTKNGLPIEERFWMHTNRKSNDECWKWMGGKDRQGYGQLNINNRTVRVHRYSYEIHKGKIPEGMDVLHTCDNPPCVNPNHLFLGNDLINAQDKVNKNRQTKGEDHPHHKLKGKDVIRIRNMFSSGKYSMHRLAKLFNICYSEMNAILHGRTWKHI